MSHSRGTPVHGHLELADAGNSLAISMYLDGAATSGNGTVVTVGDSELLTITSFIIASTGAQTNVIYLSADNDGTREDGEDIFQAPMAALAIFAQSNIEVQGAPGAGLRVDGSSTGTVSVSFTGYLTKV